ncbi:MAG TPA: antibiotic biosynthesis monooxygenase [Gemmatimonadales bacterium]|nr:antibiotic biosynthesis monooxygenase [Gemmatimonadales bacterium]
MTLDPRFAQTPAPPYYAVIFSALRTSVTDGYAEAGERMFARASQLPGFLGAQALSSSDGFEMSVLYFTDLASIRAWKEDAEHLAVQERARREWYARYQIRVARVERAYSGPEAALHPYP